MNRTISFLKKNISYILLAMAFTMLVVFNVCFYDNWLDSDMAAEMMFSKLVSEEGGLISSYRWYYSTEFRILYTQLLMVPLFKVTSNWHVVRAITNILTYVFMLASYFYFMKPLAKKIKVSKNTVVLTAVILLLPFSETMVLHMQMGNTYMPHVIIIFMWFGFYLRLWQESRKNFFTGCRWVLYIGLNILIGMSGVRYLMCVCAPSLLATFIMIFKSDEYSQLKEIANSSTEFNNKEGVSSNDIFPCVKSVFLAESAKGLYLAIVGTIFALLGYAYNVLVIAKKFTFQTYESTDFIQIFNGVFMERLQNTLGKLLDLFGYIPEKGMLSLRGLLSVVAFLVITIIVFVTVRVVKNATGFEDFVTILFISSFGINVFVYLFSNGTIVARYFIPVFILWLPILAIYIDARYEVVENALIKFLLVCCFWLMTLKVSFSFITVDKNKDLRKVSDFLLENEMTFGYATYWNANIVTELCNGRAEVANINNPSEIEFFKWSSPFKYYEDDYHLGNVFVLLTDEENEKYKDCSALVNGKKVYESSGYVIYEYDDTKTLLGMRE